MDLSGTLPSSILMMWPYHFRIACYTISISLMLTLLILKFFHSSPCLILCFLHGSQTLFFSCFHAAFVTYSSPKLHSRMEELIPKLFHTVLLLLPLTSYCFFTLPSKYSQYLLLCLPFILWLISSFSLPDSVYLNTWILYLQQSVCSILAPFMTTFISSLPFLETTITLLLGILYIYF